jgi:hypothetical protein
MRRLLLLLPVLALAACTAAPPEREVIARLQTLPDALPPMKTFAGARVTPSKRSNADIARDFLDLSFELESGRPLPVLSRFEGPITVRVTGPAPQNLYSDLNRLLARLRREAGIGISPAPEGGPASITIAVVPQAELRRYVPQAACFVAPRVTSWDEFRRHRRGATVDWTTLQTREQLTIFLPGDVAPQEVRDCLHEELAQALGPLNDLYRLPDSVFNDDNFHTVLTSFDMLVLRAYYAPELASGMTREQVAARLPGILARLNPAGERAQRLPSAKTPRDWIEAIEEALGPRATPSRRQQAARRAVEIARRNGWADNRMAFSLFALGRLSLSGESDVALASFLQARQIYAARPETRLHAAHVAMQLSAFALSSNQPEAALELIESSLPPVQEAENAALLASLLLIRAEALELMGRAAEARAVRTESLGWARYGFGSDEDVRTRAAEIAALSPRRLVAAIR